MLGLFLNVTEVPSVLVAIALPAYVNNAQRW